MKPYISIIIPTFNSSIVIEDCLLSVLNQTFKDFEIIIQDCLSNDKTIDIINDVVKKYSLSNIKVFSENDNGIYDAMNKAIQKACGNWIYFLGSDDRIYNATTFEEVFKALDVGNRNVVYGNVKISGNTSWAEDQEIYDGIFDLEKLLRKNICHQAIFYKKTFVDTIGMYNVNYRLCGDWDYNLRCFAKTEFLYIDNIIATFNAGGESTINNADEAFSSEFLSNVMKYFKLHEFDSLLNNEQFSFYHEVLLLQKTNHPAKYYVNRLKSKVKKIFK